MAFGGFQLRTVWGGWDHFDATVTSSGIQLAFSIATVLDVVASCKLEVVSFGLLDRCWQFVKKCVVEFGPYFRQV
jgi:hypothetical protein